MSRLDEIDARLAAATPGPWSEGKDYGAVVSLDPASVAAELAAHGEGHVEAYGGAFIGESMHKANRDLVAHSPEDLAWATGLLRQLLAGLADVDNQLHEGRNGNARRRVQELVKVAIGAGAL